MLTLFRRIRRGITDGSSTSRYLLYAIGEVVLVVVGILFALQINNWNEERKNHVEEQLILYGLHDEFDGNLKSIEKTIQRNRQLMSAAHELIEQLRIGSLKDKADIIDSLIVQLYIFSSFDAHTGYIDEIINSGKLSIIRDRELKRQLTKWSGMLEDVEEDLAFRSDNFSHVFVPFLIRYFPLTNGDSFIEKSSYFTRDIQFISKSPFKSKWHEVDPMEFENVIYEMKRQNDFVINNDLNLQSFLEETLAIIQKNLRE